jgi:hypothetical protein
LVEDTIKRLLELDPGAVVTYRNVDKALIPHLTPATIAGVRGVAATKAHRCAGDSRKNRSSRSEERPVDVIDNAGEGHADRDGEDPATCATL